MTLILSRRRNRRYSVEARARRKRNRRRRQDHKDAVRKAAAGKGARE